MKASNSTLAEATPKECLELAEMLVRDQSAAAITQLEAGGDWPGVRNGPWTMMEPMNTRRELHSTFCTKGLETAWCALLAVVFLWGAIDLATGWQGLDAMPGALRAVLAAVFTVLCVRMARRAINVSRGNGRDKLGPDIERIDS